MTTQPVIYTDDTDPSWTFTIRSKDDTLVDWLSPLVAVGASGYTIAATWDSDPATTRTLLVPLSTVTVDSTLYLKVPNGTDIKLGRVLVRARS